MRVPRPVHSTRAPAAALVAVVAVVVALLTAPPALAEQTSSQSHRVAASSLVAGGHHTCALLESGRLRCWGRNNRGQLGLGTTDSLGDDEAITSAPPINLGPGRTAVAIAAGDNTTCAILDTGQLRCWGRNNDGQLGLGTTDDLGDDEPITSVAPINLGPGRTAVAVSVGLEHTCAILDNGQLRCWGDNSDGQLGLGTTANLGDNEPITSVAPINLGPGRTAVAVSAGRWHTCALLDNGRLRCWGDNAYGQLGLGTSDTLGDDEPITSVAPINLGPGRTVAAVSAALGWHTCAVLDTGLLRCWGHNFYGQLGLGNTDDLGDDEAIASAPRPALPPVRSVSGGTDHTCAALTSGAARCWGFNNLGQLGLGNTVPLGDDEPITSVAPIPLGAGAVHVSSGFAHSCALLTTGRVRCWGFNQFGQLGLGTTTALGDDEAVSTLPPLALDRAVRTRATTTLSAQTKPGRDRTKPYRYRIAGRVRGAFAVDDATCSGRVRATTRGKVKARLRGHAKVRPIRVAGTARTTLRRVGRTCTYQLRVTVKPAKKKQARQVVGRLRGKPRITVRLPATGNLAPAVARVRVRLG